MKWMHITCLLFKIHGLYSIVCVYCVVTWPINIVKTWCILKFSWALALALFMKNIWLCRKHHGGRRREINHRRWQLANYNVTNVLNVVASCIVMNNMCAMYGHHYAADWAHHKEPSTAQSTTCTYIETSATVIRNAIKGFISSWTCETVCAMLQCEITRKERLM